jgi:ribosomal protein S18 acetylase RimI-like enzyme
MMDAEAPRRAADRRPGVIRDGGEDDVDGVARVWAAATAARDGRARPAALAVARAPIAAAMAEPQALLVIAAEPDVVAFAIAAPARDGDPCDAEVRFLGVAPDRWGEGLGAQVMHRLLERLDQRGDRSASLLVYVDNAPAIRLYERCGWVAADAPPTVHPTSGRLEQRYLRALAPFPP